MPRKAITVRHVHPAFFTETPPPISSVNFTEEDDGTYSMWVSDNGREKEAGSYWTKWFAGEIA